MAWGYAGGRRAKMAYSRPTRRRFFGRRGSRTWKAASRIQSAFRRYRSRKAAGKTRRPPFNHSRPYRSRVGWGGY